jgi:hypothetical protein
MSRSHAGILGQLYRELCSEAVVVIERAYDAGRSLAALSNVAVAAVPPQLARAEVSSNRPVMPAILSTISWHSNHHQPELDIAKASNDPGIWS